MNKGMCGETSQETIASQEIIWVINNGDLAQGGGSRDGEKWMDQRYILVVGPGTHSWICIWEKREMKEFKIDFDSGV